MYSICWSNSCPSDHTHTPVLSHLPQSTHSRVNLQLLAFLWAEGFSPLRMHLPYSEDICGSHNFLLQLCSHCGYWTSGPFKGLCWWWQSRRSEISRVDTLPTSPKKTPRPRTIHRLHSLMILTCLQSMLRMRRNENRPYLLALLCK